jgi:hypothetical protein
VLALRDALRRAFLLDHPALWRRCSSGAAVTVEHALAAVLYRMRWLMIPVFVFTTIIWTSSTRARRASRRSLVALPLRPRDGAPARDLPRDRLPLSRDHDHRGVRLRARALGVPYRAGFVLTLAFRLVPVFLDAALTVRDAQRCRGLDFTTGSVASGSRATCR